jgi:hypothetical protein
MGHFMKPMIILGTIQRVEKLNMDDRTEKDAFGKAKKVDLYQIVIADAARPVQFRGEIFLQTYLMGDKLREVMGTVVPDELADEKITFWAKSMTPSNAVIKIKGQMVKGHHTGEHLTKMMASAIETDSDQIPMNHEAPAKLAPGPAKTQVPAK